MTWRAADELLERVRRAAEHRGRSMNDYVTAVLAAATDPTFAGSEAERMRERLAAAGLLAVSTGRVRARPDAAALARARRGASRGAPVHDLVGRERE